MWGTVAARLGTAGGDPPSGVIDEASSTKIFLFLELD